MVSSLKSHPGYRSSEDMMDCAHPPYSPSKQYLEVPPSSVRSGSPRISTLRRKTAEVFGEEDGTFLNLWDLDDEEFAEQLESLKINPTQRIRGNPLRSLQNSPSPPPSRRGRSSPFASSEHSPARSTWASPLHSAFNSPTKQGAVNPINTEEGGPVKSMWDTDDDEFDRWPGQDE